MAVLSLQHVLNPSSPLQMNFIWDAVTTYQKITKLADSFMVPI